MISKLSGYVPVRIDGITLKAAKSDIDKVVDWHTFKDKSAGVDNCIQVGKYGDTVILRNTASPGFMVTGTVQEAVAMLGKKRSRMAGLIG